MSAKNKDNKQRWRSITIGFRVSPEEAYALDMRVNASGLTKQDYCTKKVLDEDVIVRPNIRVQKVICQYLDELTEEQRTAIIRIIEGFLKEHKSADSERKHTPKVSK